MLFGHNPGISEFCRFLTDERFEDVPTCAVSEIQLHTNWRELGQFSGELIDLDYPKKRNG